MVTFQNTHTAAGGATRTHLENVCKTTNGRFAQFINFFVTLPPPSLPVAEWLHDARNLRTFSFDLSPAEGSAHGASFIQEQEQEQSTEGTFCAFFFRFYAQNMAHAAGVSCVNDTGGQMYSLL